MSDQNRIFDWLGTAGTVPYYLIPLNLVWSDKGADFDLEHFKNVAGRLEDEPEYWRDLFRRHGWREQLVASTCALAVGSRLYRDDIQYAIMQDSFVVPQLLVALSLLHYDSAHDWITSAAATKWPSERFKTYGAFEVICHRLSLPFNPPSEYRNLLESDEYSIGKMTAEEHMDFWAPRLLT